MEAQLRTMILALESLVGIRLEFDMHILLRLMEYAADMINRIKVQRRDGRSSYERKFGNRD